ncbi:MAG: MBL fold metallo-hydrolase, partial [Nitrososphaera sp.]|nr:MBL fold metallo-hydrolase [Nitrososphaera sp.]
RLSESTEASLITLGGFAEVGRSCMLLSTQESKILLDCGINLSAKDSMAAYPRFDVAGLAMEDIDAVVISHAHLDHTGFLPALFKYGFSGPVYCTEPTLLLMSMLQGEYIKRTGINALYSDKDVDSSVMHTITLTHGIVTDISPDVKLVLYNAGHILGSTSIHLHIGNGDHNLVYTGDTKFGRTLSLENASWNFPRAETMIIESTFGGKEDVMCRPEDAEAKLVHLINDTILAGGHVLLPVPEAGTAQELILLLDKCSREGRLKQQTKVLVEKIILDATSVYEAYSEFLSRELRDRVLKSDESQFGSRDRFIGVESADLGNEPAVVLAPSSMLDEGPSIHYLKQIAADPKSTLAFVCYQAIGTVGRAIQEGARQVMAKDQSIVLRCRIEFIDGLGSHSDYNQLIAYVSRLRPKLRRVLVNHGERAKAQNLASSINKLFKIQTQHPLVQEAVKLL